MKQRILVGLLFLLAYLGFLVAHLPAQWALRMAPLPAALSISGVSGTLWAGQAAHVSYGREAVSQLHWRLDGWSLLTLSPALDISFGERSGVNGRGRLAWEGGIRAQDLVLNAPAPWLLARLPQRPPFPLEVAGRVQLTVDDYRQGQPWCDSLYGTLDWVGARADTPAGKLDLADPSAKLLCQKGNLVAELTQASEQVALTGKLELMGGRRYLFQGALKPGAALPETMRQGLPLLGQPDSQGRYPLRQQGRF